MLLLELFSWLNSEKSDFSLNNKICLNSTVTSELQHAIEHRRELLGELHSARAVSMHNDAPQRLLQHDAYIQFLEHLIKKPDISLSIRALECLLDPQTHYPHKEEKIISIFSKLIVEQNAEAIAFYQEQEDAFLPFPQIKILVATDKTNKLFTSFTTALENQDNPLSVVPFFMASIEDPEYIAAANLWLIQRGVTPQRMLQTNLLQQFMSYHSAWLDTPESPIHLLYEILKYFPQANSLIQIAGTTQCEVRGFYNDGNNARSYALTGMLCEQSKLQRTAIIDTPIEFSSSASNFEKLYRLFGIQFIPQALVWHAEQGDVEWSDALKFLLNQEETISNHIEGIINAVATKCSPALLHLFSDFILDDNIDKLLARHSGAVFHFISSKPELLARISQVEMSAYLRQLSTNGSDPFDLMPQLIALLKACEKENQELAISVYQTIIDVVIANPTLLDDRDLIRQLRKFPDKESLLNQRYSDLQMQLERYLTDYSVAGSLTIQNYHLIEDLWRQLAFKITTLSQIMPSYQSFPVDKYKLQTLWAQKFVCANPDFFILNDFVEALELIPQLADKEVNEYERLLIELITSIDNENLRITIIARFNENIVKKDHWIKQIYGGKDMFERAMKKGNLGLIRWLAPQFIVDDQTANAALLNAAENMQWAILDHICEASPYPISQETFKSLLITASRHGKLSIVMHLCEKGISHLQNQHKDKNIDKALILAAANGHQNILQYLCEQVPNQNLQVRAFNVAIQSERFETIKYLGNLPQTDVLRSIAERTLLQAVTRNNFLMVQEICNLQSNAPRAYILTSAFLKAAKFGHLPLIEYFYKLPRKNISQKEIDTAFTEAITHDQFPVAEYLCQLEDKPPRRLVIENLLLTAIKHGDLHVIMNIYQLTLKLNQLELLQNLCQLNPPPKQVILKAQRKAALQGYDHVASFLGELSHFIANRAQRKKPSCEKRENADVSRASIDASSKNYLLEETEPVEESMAVPLQRFGMFRYKDIPVSRAKGTQKEFRLG